MVRRTRESSIESHLVLRCKQARGECVKQYRRGWPDRLCVLPGRMFFVETKKPKGSRFEALQLRTHAKIRKMGHTVYVAYTRDEVDALFI